MSNMDGHDAPYPGMAAAFEAHTGQSWTDPDWRNETATWAAAWKAAKATTPTAYFATHPNVTDQCDDGNPR